MKPVHVGGVLEVKYRVLFPRKKRCEQQLELCEYSKPQIPDTHVRGHWGLALWFFVGENRSGYAADE
jgi:hypothetical protein